MDGTKDEVYLPIIQCIFTTTSVQAGINVIWLKYGKKKGLPVWPYKQVQEFGFVDRKMNAAPGSNTCEIPLDFNSYVSMFLWTMQCDNITERKKLLLAHHTVMGYKSATIYSRRITLGGIPSQTNNLSNTSAPIVLDMCLTLQRELIRNFWYRFYQVKSAHMVRRHRPLTSLNRWSRTRITFFTKMMFQKRRWVKFMHLICNW